MRKVNIAGIPTDVEDCEIETVKILLDQENPRISYYKDSQPKDTINQDEINYAIISKNPDAFEKLKESIESNHGLLYPIWVVNLGNNEYRVIEGNTRLVIYRQLQEKFLNDYSYNKIPCWILPEGVKEDQMSFLRLEAHLRGTTDWDTYEKARYLYKLSEDEGYSVEKLERQTKLTKNDIENQIELFSGKTMEERKLITGLQPKRADVILAGALIIKMIMLKLRANSFIVSDMGIRHGIILDRF